jgi:hypothetical protein
MVLSDVEEMVTVVEVDEENEDEAVRASSPNHASLITCVPCSFRAVLMG